MASMATPDPNATRLADTFNGQAPSSHPERWDDLWKENYTPWDRGFSSAGLVDLLANSKDHLSSNLGRKKALVPGCGRGYDVLLLSSWGYDAYGLDFSTSALEAARKVEREMGGTGIYATKEGVEKGTITWVAGDFFKDEWLKSVEGEKSFELIYDYTVGKLDVICLI
jgi:SAM-dependent methyltransferase